MCPYCESRGGYNRHRVRTRTRWQQERLSRRMKTKKNKALSEQKYDKTKLSTGNIAYEIKLYSSHSTKHQHTAIIRTDE